ncbi:hypothetical protein GCM10022237_22070 [Nocardioides ginsengisoli]
MVRICSLSDVYRALISRTAWIRRIAASPRLTMAIRETVGTLRPFHLAAASLQCRSHRVGRDSLLTLPERRAPPAVASSSWQPS